MDTPKGKFYGISGAIGLTVDTITLISYATSWINPSTQLNWILFLVSIYSWVSISAYLIRRGYLISAPKGILQRRLPVIRNTFFSIGILFGVLNLLLSFQTNKYFILYQIAFIPFGYWLIYSLLPTIYPDMRIYLTRIGVYKCEEQTWTKKTGKYESNLILAGETVHVIKPYRLRLELIPDHYLVKVRHQDGIMKYDNILSLFRISKIKSKSDI